MIACVDIGGTSIKVGVLDKSGKVYFTDSLLVHNELEKFIDTIVYWVESVKKNFDILGLAISSPGTVDKKSGIVGGASAVPCIHGPNLKQIFSERCGLKVSIENDANCAALSEIFNGSAQNAEYMMFVVCGTGIGGAIIHKGEVHSGKNLYGGEFGYMLVEDEGKLTNFSRVASTISLVNRVKNYYKDDSWDGEKVFLEAEKGNEICKEAIDRFYFNLAKGIFNLQYVYDPEIILLGGAISERKDFIKNINEKLDYIMNEIEIAKIKPNISTCTHKKNANLVGALANFLKEYEV